MPPKSSENIKNRDWVYDAYVNQGMTMDEVAVAASCSRSQVVRAMNRFGIPRRKRKSKYPLLNDKEWLIDAYLNQNMSTEIIAEKAGCDSGIVHGMLKNLGVRTRTMREAQQLRVKEGRGTGENASNWKGGRIIHGTGYAFIRCPDHPNKNSAGYVAEHRLVMEQKIGRYLKSYEAVHHIDGDKLNNSIDNLMVVTRKTHAMLHKEQIREFGRLQNHIIELEGRLAKYEQLYGPIVED